MSIGFLLASKNDAVIWRGARKDSLIRQFLTDVDWGALDYLIVDTPPGTTDEHLSIVKLLQLGPGDGALLVTTPQEVALNDVRKEIGFCLKTGTRMLGLVENMAGFVCPHCECSSAIFPRGGIEALCKEFQLEVLASLPLEAQVSQSAEKGLWIGDAEGKGRAKAAFLELAGRVQARLEVT
jgi:Mrp family chromosome partitioning ATPase